jgi:hypothetical protein
MGCRLPAVERASRAKVGPDRRVSSFAGDIATPSVQSLSRSAPVVDLEAGLRDRPAPSSEPPTEDELVALLSERARAGNVSAIRSLLVREHLADPRERAVELFRSMVENRQ